MIPADTSSEKEAGIEEEMKETKNHFLKGKWMNANTEWQERFLLRFCEPQKHTKRRGKREGKANEDEKEKQEKTRKQINPHKWCLNGRKRQKTG